MVMGPTAVGKSALALEVAERLDGEIINADALQVYRGFDVGTAKPTAAGRERIPHHLLDILDPQQRFSAGEFARRADDAREDIMSRGRIPIVVGGSGFYLRAFLDGIAPIPSVDAELSNYLSRRCEREGLTSSRAELCLLDPESAARLAPGDTQRTLRALAVALSTGRKLSSWIKEAPFGERSVASLRIGLTLPRAILYDRIADRVRSMVQDGWLNEVRGLLQRGLSPLLPAFQAIGYQQLASVVRKECALDTAIEEIIQATRRFAKRQEIWYRKEPNVTWYSATNLQQSQEEILALWDRLSRRGTHAESQH